jgi:PKD repeat protein
VQFHDRSLSDGNSITSWEWDFSDGSIVAGDLESENLDFIQNPRNCFAAGDYVVILRVSNDFPMSDTDYQIITVPVSWTGDLD